MIPCRGREALQARTERQSAAHGSRGQAGTLRSGALRATLDVEAQLTACRPRADDPREPENKKVTPC